MLREVVQLTQGCPSGSYPGSHARDCGQVRAQGVRGEKTRVAPGGLVLVATFLSWTARPDPRPSCVSTLIPWRKTSRLRVRKSAPPRKCVIACGRFATECDAPLPASNFRTSIPEVGASTRHGIVPNLGDETKLILARLRCSSYPRGPNSAEVTTASGKP